VRIIKNILDFLLKKDFTKNLITMYTGAIIGQIIALLIVPLLTRIFSAEQFGDMALYVSMANVLGLISTFLYDKAIVLSKDEDEAFHTSVISSSFVLLFAFICFFVILIFHNSFVQLLDAKRISIYLYFLPLSIIFLGFGRVFQGWFNFLKKYKILSVNRIVQISSTNFTNFLLGLIFRPQTLLLFIGNIFSQFMTSFMFIFYISKNKLINFKNISFSKIKKLIIEYRSFPFYTMPMVLLNSISLDILIYTLNINYSPEMVGYYVNSRRMMYYPLTLLSVSFTTVFYKKMVDTDKKIKLYLSSYFINLAMAFFILIPIVFFGKEIYVFILGKNWALSGTMAIILAPFVAFNYATQTISDVFAATKRNEILLIWQIFYLFLALAVILFFKYLDLLDLLKIFTIYGSIMYIILAIVGYFTLKNHVFKLSIDKK
jgi:O-antigen/teichoic acid export membrane protein